MRDIIGLDGKVFHPCRLSGVVVTVTHEIYLSPEQVDTAIKLGMSYDTYAVNHMIAQARIRGYVSLNDKEL